VQPRRNTPVAQPWLTVSPLSAIEDLACDAGVILRATEAETHVRRRSHAEAVNPAQPACSCRVREIWSTTGSRIRPRSEHSRSRSERAGGFPSRTREYRKSTLAGSRPSRHPSAGRRLSGTALKMRLMPSRGKRRRSDTDLGSRRHFAIEIDTRVPAGRCGPAATNASVNRVLLMVRGELDRTWRVHVIVFMADGRVRVVQTCRPERRAHFSKMRSEASARRPSASARCWAAARSLLVV
jgi:hypothetical protein